MKNMFIMFSNDAKRWNYAKSAFECYKISEKTFDSVWKWL